MSFSFLQKKKKKDGTESGSATVYLFVGLGPLHFPSTKMGINNGSILSNYGEALKIMLPNCIWKHTSGWTNHSGMVTRYDMNESEMGNRVSKSVSAVKEQRVDGSSYDLWSWLRYTLMVREIGCLVNVPSKLIPSEGHLSGDFMYPWFVTGFTDAEGCFNVKLTKSEGKLRWRVNVSFLIVLHVKDKALLEHIQTYFGGVGTVRVYKDTVRFDVSSVKDLLNVIIPHFKLYPLLSQKEADFLLFEQVVQLMILKKHLTESGLLSILGLRANLNKGMEVKNIPNCVPVDRPIVTLPDTLNPNWVSGFTSGDGGFFVHVTDSQSHSLGRRVRLRYEVCQDVRDKHLMSMLVSFFGCGTIYESGTMVKFTVLDFSNIWDNIIPIFNKYPVIGVKYENYLDWCEVAKLMHNKMHLTAEGLQRITTITRGMNKNRPLNDE
uniref:Homing endonuclease LAGLIDADG domain-containing protein n=1 Tax=Microbotryum lychnidis-dioicae TaxID=288795 RepID=M1GME3_9BASI|nr:hypothetical protein H911_mgp01 [Microbotryum lychnidis-dioicae]AGE14564.1 hypothetical protein [Microbotryum lychnidis-dioicae]